MEKKIQSTNHKPQLNKIVYGYYKNHRFIFHLKSNNTENSSSIEQFHALNFKFPFL